MAVAVAAAAAAPEHLLGFRVGQRGVRTDVLIFICLQRVASLPEQGLTEFQERTSDPDYASMKSKVLEVKNALQNGFQLQHLSALTEDLEEKHRRSIELQQFPENTIFFADHIPATKEEHAAANDALLQKGFVTINTESVAFEVVDSPAFKKLERGRLFEAVCLEEKAARECLRSEEEVFEGVDTDSEKESEDSERRSDGFVPCAVKEGGRGKRGKGSTRNITAILVCVYSFLVGVGKFKNIFQIFKKNENGDLIEEVGDGKRLQVKMRQLPEVKRKHKEEDAPYYRRLAGREFLIQFLHKVFFLLCDWLPTEYTFERFWDDMFAGIVKTLGLASGQHLHADKEPDRHGLGVAVLINLSIWSHWITCLINSSKNIETLVEYYNQNYDLFSKVYLANTPEIVVDSLSQEKLKKMLLLPWQCHLYLHVRDHAGSFLPMQLADIELVPALMTVFRLSHVHGGGPYPGKIPRRLRDYSVPSAQKRKLSPAKRRWQYRYGKAHFRSGPKCPLDFSCTSD